VDIDAVHVIRDESQITKRFNSRRKRDCLIPAGERDKAKKTAHFSEVRRNPLRVFPDIRTCQASLLAAASALDADQ
jgi:hypothetical protein